MYNFEWCVYTYRHRRAFRYCVEKYIKDPALRAEMIRRAELHDMDKMLNYLKMPQREAQMIHIETQPHHLENELERTYEDYVEAVIDYECAPYTKPDKPMNAYELVSLMMAWNMIDLENSSKLMEVIEALGIDNPDTCRNDVEGREYINSIGEVTETMIKEEILEYLHRRR